MDRLGSRDAFERWDEAGRPDVLAEARAVAEAMIASHDPLPLDEAAVRELARIERAARAADASAATTPARIG